VNKANNLEVSNTNEEKIIENNRETANENYETGIKRLEEIVKRLENGDITLEEGLSFYEEGISLVKKCQNQLDRASQRIQVLQKGELVDLADQNGAE
jgi:exodeoxyribonuclease VII small subunit